MPSKEEAMREALALAKLKQDQEARRAAQPGMELEEMTRLLQRPVKPQAPKAPSSYPQTRLDPVYGSPYLRKPARALLPVEHVDCGPAKDGSLLCFLREPNQTLAVRDVDLLSTTARVQFWKDKALIGFTQPTLCEVDVHERTLICEGKAEVERREEQAELQRRRRRGEEAESVTRVAAPSAVRVQERGLEGLREQGRSQEEARQRLRDALADLPPAGWYTGRPRETREGE